jgi:hypothetical protein
VTSFTAAPINKTFSVSAHRQLAAKMKRAALLAAKSLTHDARRIAVNIAKLPELSLR